MINNAIFIGNLARDPELRYAKEMAVLNTTVAVNDKYKDEEKTYWIPVTVFGRTAENVERFCKKGSKVCVTGKITTDTYADKDGNKKTSWSVIASQIEFLPQGDKSIDKAEKTSENAMESPRSASEPQGFTQLKDDDIPF